MRFRLLVALLAGVPTQVEAAQYERPPALEAAKVLGAEAVAGPHFQIEPRVVNDGRMNRFVVRSEFQRIEAYGDSLALERAHEQEAIAALREIKRTEAYADGLAAATRAPIAVTRQALSDPVRVVQGMSKGVSNLVSDLRSALGGVAKGSSEELDEAAVLKDLIGYSAVKRRLAAELHVDPFSSNAVLQEDLDDVTWAVFAGGATIDVAMSQTPMAASLAVKATRRIDSAESAAWEIPTPTLMKASASALEAMGLNPAEAEALVWHPTCTLTHQTALVGALAALDGVAGRDAFARLATGAGDENECRRYRETAELIWSYHTRRRPLAALAVKGDVVEMRDVDGRVVLPLQADYLVWTPEAEASVKGLPRSGKRSLWISGRASGRSLKALGQQGVRVDVRVFEGQPETVDVAAELTPERAEAADAETEENRTGKLARDMKDGAGNLLNGLGSAVFRGGDDEAEPAGE